MQRIKRSNSHLDSVQFKTDLQKQCLLHAAEDREWDVTSSEDDWHVYWASVGKVRKIFNVETGVRLKDNQIINHYPNHYELTRKDLMVKNIKRYRKTLERQGNPIASRNNQGLYVHLDFVPSTYRYFFYFHFLFFLFFLYFYCFMLCIKRKTFTHAHTKFTWRLSFV